MVQRSQGGDGTSEKEGPEATLSFPELAVCLIGKEHVTKMKPNLNFFLIWSSNSADSYCTLQSP